MDVKDMDWANPVSTVVGTGLGLATANWSDRRQLKQQEKLNQLQIKGSKELGKYNQGLALDMWNKTNYEAQRRHMEAAGLNVGLMYGMGGGGGVTANAGGGGSVSGGNAPVGGGEIGMGIQLGLQNALTQAQIQLAESQANKNNVEAAKTAGVDTAAVQQGMEESKSRIAKNDAEITNIGFKNLLTEQETEYQRLINNLTKEGLQDNLRQLKAKADQTEAEAKKAGVDAKYAEETVKRNFNEQALRMTAISMGIKVDQAQINKIGAEINKMKADVWQGWGKLDKEQQRIELQKQGVDFSTSTPEQIHQWLSMVTEVWNAAMRTPSGGGYKPVGGFGQ